MVVDVPNHVFSAFAFIGFILVSIPLPWHFEAWNTGTCLYMIWTGIGCLIGFINSIVWNRNVGNWAPVWCDISSRLMVGMSVAIPAASLCINRRLYLIATRSYTSTKAEKQRAILVDLAIGLGIPVLEMILQYTVQGHRFNIFEDIGCYPMTYNTPVSYPVVYCWPIVIGLVSAVYCSLTITALVKRRNELDQMFTGISNLTSSRHFRLMALAGIEILFTIPWAAYTTLYLNIAANGASESPINPYKSWANVHANFGYVGQFPAIEWKQSSTVVVALELNRWAKVICAFIFFAFFGFADEARKNYWLAFHFVARKAGSATYVQSELSMMSVSRDTRGILPVFITKETTRKRDFCDTSFSTDLSLENIHRAHDDAKEPHTPTV